MNGFPPLDASAILRKNGIRPRHRLGQNFLQDPEALQKIVEAGGISSSDVVLEIGCGLGSLTVFLAQAARRVVAVEVDPRLAAVASEALRAFGNVEIVCADFLELNPAGLGLPHGYVVAANIPYYITSPILRRVLESEPGPNRIVLTVQKEVAARICAGPPEMSLLALSVQVYGSAKVVAAIPARSFFPVPKVDSAVVRVDCHEQPLVPSVLMGSYFKVAKAGFGQPRKMLSNALSAGLRIQTSAARSMLLQAGIDPRRRAETLAVQEWLQLAQTVSGDVP